MGTVWWNLALRFALELAALLGFGIAGWRLTPAPWHWLATPALVVLAACLWGIFNVPGDPSRSGKAPVVVPGLLRLLIELAVLFGGATAIAASGYRGAGVVLAVLIAVHYLLSLDRIRWLLER